MRNHEPLIVMRRRGMKPAHVTLCNEGAAWYGRWYQFPELLPFPEVHIDDDDTPELLDLRFVVGLPVIVDLGEHVERMRRLVLACEDAGAGVVFGFASRKTGYERYESLAAICTKGEDQSWRT